MNQHVNPLSDHVNVILKRCMHHLQRFRQHTTRHGAAAARISPAHTWGLQHLLWRTNLFSYNTSQVILNPRDRNGDPGAIACMQSPDHALHQANVGRQEGTHKSATDVS